MRYKILSILLIAVLVFSLTSTAFAGNVSVPDANLATALRALAGIPDGEAITSEKLAAITGKVDLSNSNISEIEGIQYLTGAESIDLSLNSIGSVPREIERLTSLKSLDLSGNRISRLPSNIGGLSGLRNLDIRANRLEEIPSNLKKLTLDTFKCDYNFLDVSDGSSALSTINYISAMTKEYKNQLVPIQGFSAYSPENGSIILYWNAMESLAFDGGAVGAIERIVILGDSYDFINQTTGSARSYRIDGKDTTTEYTFYVGVEYHITGTKYSGVYNKVYSKITLKAVPENTPMPEIVATETPSPTPVPATDTPVPATATPVPATNTPAPTLEPVATQAPPQKGGTVNTIYIIIIILAAIFVFITLLIIARAIAQKKNRNTRYRR